jgi:hypothetical protein
MPEGVDIQLEPGSTRFDALDDRWTAQVNDFASELSREVGSVRRSAEPQPGSKGAVASIVLTLGSAGAFTAAAEFLKSWLERDRTRVIKAAWTEDGQPVTIELSGDGIEKGTLDRLASAVEARIIPPS